jgi:hypothetical protein
MMGSVVRIAGQLVAGSLLATSADAQCMRWSSEFASGPDTRVDAFQNFDDGTGPALYAGGFFTYIVNYQGSWLSPRIARWRNHAWEPVGWGFDDAVLCLAVFDEGGGPRLFAGGIFTWPSYGLARWDGASWSAVPGPWGYPGADIRALCVFTEAQGPALYAAGNFGYPTYNHIARWNGSTWSSLGAGLTSTFGPDAILVTSMCVFDDGSGSALYVAGSFTHAGGIPAHRIARWDGTSWSSLAGNPADAIQELVVFDDGMGPALFATGWPGNLFRWDGSNWSIVGSELQTVPDCLGVFDDGSGEALYVGGRFDGVGTTWMQSIMRWNGSTWSGLGIGVELNGRVRSLGVHDDGTGPALAVGGNFGLAGDLPSRCVGMWLGCTDQISAVCFGDGTLRACPCGSNGAYGHGCPNSVVAAGSRLYTSGSTAADDLRLEASGLPPIATTLFVQGNAVLSGAPLFGDGVRCTGGTQLRLHVGSAQAGQSWVPDTGTPSLRARALAAGDPLLPGSVRYYQAVYRDPAPGFCAAPTGGTFNTTNGLRVVW